MSFWICDFILNKNFNYVFMNKFSIHFSLNLHPIFFQFEFEFNWNLIQLLNLNWLNLKFNFIKIELNSNSI
jgi:hypothetical protein